MVGFPSRLSCALMAALFLNYVTIADAKGRMESEGNRAARVSFAPWTVQTSIGVPYFAEVGPRHQSKALFGADPVQPILPSPDGKRFLVIISRGILATDQNQSELLVFDTADVDKATAEGRTPTPLKVLSRRSASNAAALAHPRWSADGRSILILMVDDQELRAVSGLEQQINGIARSDSANTKWRRFDLDTGKISDLTPSGVSLDDRFDSEILAWRGDYLLYASRPALGEAHLPAPDSYPISQVTVQNVGGLANRSVYIQRGPHAIYLSKAGATVKTALNYSFNTRGAFSPTEDSAIVIESVGVPERQSATQSIRQFREQGLRFTALDTNTGEITPLFNAANRTAMGSKSPPSVLWEPDGQRAILFNVQLPEKGDQSNSSSTAYVASYDTRSGAIDPITPLEIEGRFLQDVAWDVPGRTLRMRVINSQMKAVGEYYFSRLKTGWARVMASKRPVSGVMSWTFPDHSAGRDAKAEPIRVSNGLSLELREGPAQPQILIARRGKREIAVVPADTSLKNVAIAPSRIVEWKTPDGNNERGLLTVPLRPMPEGGYPLVIQNYFVMPHLFRPDGPSPSAYAAQALAARGMAVLGVDLSHYEILRGASGSEGQHGVMSIDAAVDKLSNDGLINPSRVGMVGFSRGGYVPFYAITHPGRHRLAAAISWDAALFTYQSYLSMIAGHFPAYDSDNSFEQTVTNLKSGGNFWANKELWLTENPEFNADKIKTPFMYVTNGLSGSEGADLSAAQVHSNLMALFAISHSPLELLNMPLGIHALMRPREREASLTATVDWMDFWLLGHEDSDPAKVEKYARWRSMRADWKRQQAWEAAGNPLGSRPDPKFMPLPNSGS